MEHGFCTDKVTMSVSCNIQWIGLNFHAVFVEEPWPPNVFFPRGSSAVVSCTARRSLHQEWFITLPGAPTASQFTQEGIRLLHSENIYKMPAIKLELTKTIRLYINDTEGKNGTRIKCVNPTMAVIISETTLIGELILLS